MTVTGLTAALTVAAGFGGAATADVNARAISPVATSVLLLTKYLPN